ncbi:MAG: ATP-dependent DNA helicase RecG, partial [Bacteroidales bacterium]|nr:ATP-dependent DNA helicase RecG [Bacteroidales bacterium]
HQLRGRVGRGASQSFCILLTAYKLSETSRKRLKTMVETTDGFRIAEADLQLRGQGEIEGTRQSGKMADLQIADLSTDQHILQYAYETARDILDADPELQTQEHRMLRQQLALRRASTINWGRIS